MTDPLYVSDFGEVSGLQEFLDGWQPIDSAPKDGTEIIGAAIQTYEGFEPLIEGPWTMRYDDGKWCSSWDGSEVVCYMCDFGTDYKELPIDPTRWMPLPELPSPQELLG